MARRPRRDTPRQMQHACEAFNARFKVGDEITVYTGPVRENPKRATIRHPAQVLGGHTAVVYVEGEAHGSIALTHVGEC